MVPIIFAISITQYLLGPLLFILSLFLILLILVQRGRGGGLTGALGGMGGQSAFGSKAGDVFTRVTVVVASVWIVLCLLTIGLFTKTGFSNTGEPRNPAAVTPDDKIEPPPIKQKAGSTSGGAGKKGAAAPSGKGTNNKSNAGASSND